MSSTKAAVLYAAALIPAAVAALVVTGTLMDVASVRSGQPSGFIEWSFNILPPFAVGFAIFTWLSRFVCRRQSDAGSFDKHFRRSAALYFIALAVGILVAHDAPRPEFWSLGQLVFWPWVATLAGIAADLFTTLRGPRAGR